MKKIWFTRGLEWLYPPKCLLCGELLPLEKAERELCTRCKEEMPWITQLICVQCGRPLLSGEEMRCERCRQSAFVFDRAISVFIYEEIHQSIKRFKFRECKHDAVGLGKIMANYLKTFYADLLEETDYLIAVPMHHKKQQKRGFNQSILLAKEIEKHTGIPCVEDCLVRTRNTVPQSKLTPTQRRVNIQNAFLLKDKEKLQEKNIVLVDDIFTTGATVNECTTILYQGGAKKVTVFCLSIAVESHRSV
jgi:competence protein ComFC